MSCGRTEAKGLSIPLTPMTNSPIELTETENTTASLLGAQPSETKLEGRHQRIKNKKQIC